MYTTMEEAGVVSARDVPVPGLPSSRRRALLLAGVGVFVAVLLALVILAMGTTTATSTMTIGVQARAAHGAPAMTVGVQSQAAHGAPAMTVGVQSQAAHGAPAMTVGVQSQAAHGAPTSDVDRPCCFTEPSCGHLSYTSCIVANGTRIYCCVPCWGLNPVCTTTTSTMTTTSTTTTTTCPLVVWVTPPNNGDMNEYKKWLFIFDAKTSYYRQAWGDRFQFGRKVWRCPSTTLTSTSTTTTDF
jgi:hypothetical protein